MAATDHCCCRLSSGRLAAHEVRCTGHVDACRHAHPEQPIPDLSGTASSGCRLIAPHVDMIVIFVGEIIGKGAKDLHIPSPRITPLIQIHFQMAGFK